MLTKVKAVLQESREEINIKRTVLRSVMAEVVSGVSAHQVQKKNQYYRNAYNRACVPPGNHIDSITGWIDPITPSGISPRGIVTR